MVYGLIMCAGNQTRFSCSTPKALAKINNETIVYENFRNLKQLCDYVFVVTTEDKLYYFADYDIITIDSGLGCGDAVMKALNNLHLTPDDTCFIVWGDSLPDEEIYIQAKNNYYGKVVIPCVIEDNPYVQIVENNNSVNVKFSKFNDDITKGYHDLCVFYGNCKDILNHCNIFKDKYFKNNKYVHKHNEFSFLDLFNDTNLKGEILELKGVKTYSFNTYEELLALGGTIN